MMNAKPILVLKFKRTITKDEREIVRKDVLKAVDNEYHVLIGSGFAELDETIMLEVLHCTHKTEDEINHLIEDIKETCSE